MPSLDIKYWEPKGDGGCWGIRRRNGPPTPWGTFTVCMVVMGPPSSTVFQELSDQERVRRVSDILRNETPTVVILSEVTPEQHFLLLESDFVKGKYGVTDFAGLSCSVSTKGQPTNKEHSCTILILHGVSADFAEHKVKADWGPQQIFRPVVLLHVRQFMGKHFVFGVAHFDPFQFVSERVSTIKSIVQKIDPADVTILGGNFYEVSNVDGRRAAVDIDMSSVEFVNTHNDFPGGANHSLWLRLKDDREGFSVSSVRSLDSLNNNFVFASITTFKCNTLSPTSTSTMSSGSTPHLLTAQIGDSNTNMMGNPNTNAVANKNYTGKSTGVPPTPMTVDPAVVSVETDKSHTGKGGQGDQGAIDISNSNSNISKSRQVSDQFTNASVVSTVVPQRGPQKRRWKAEWRIFIKKPHTFDNDNFDQSARFRNHEDSVEELNSGRFPWDFDFIIVRPNLLYCDHVPTCSVGIFKKYAAGVRSRMAAYMLHHERLIQQARLNCAVGPIDVGATSTDNEQKRLAANSSNSTGPSGSGSMVTGPQSNQMTTAARHTIQRQRVWSEHCCTMIYQIAPPEMKFDVTKAAGADVNSLPKVIQRLNAKHRLTNVTEGKEVKQDPLMNYPHDYALLLSQEKQGYWLIACTDVPCDVVCCRAAAKVR